MASVTGFYLRSDSKPFPAAMAPEVVAIPSHAFYTVGGRSISTAEQTVTPNATTGAYAFDLEPTVNALETDVHYTIRGTFQDPNFYKPGAGAGRRDYFEMKIVVPAEGGSVGDLAVITTPHGLAWEGSTPPAYSGLWLYVDPAYDPNSGDPLPVYTAPDGTQVTHGELVEWEA